MNDEEREALLMSWHDGSCPEGPGCRSRLAHAQTQGAWAVVGGSVQRAVEAIIEARTTDLAGLLVRILRENRVRHDHAYPVEVGSDHHCAGCDLLADIRAALSSAQPDTERGTPTPPHNRGGKLMSETEREAAYDVGLNDHRAHDCCTGRIPEPLAQAIRDVCWKAQPYGEDDEGFVTYYLLSVGPIHRLIGAAQGVVADVALRAALTPAPTPDDAEGKG